MFLSTEFPGGPRVFASRPASVRVCRGQWGAGQRIPHHNHWNRYFILDWYFIMNSNIVTINVLSTLATAMLSAFYSCVLLLYQLLSHLGFSFLYMILYGKHQLSFLRYERAKKSFFLFCTKGNEWAVRHSQAWYRCKACRFSTLPVTNRHGKYTMGIHVNSLCSVHDKFV